MEKAPNLLYKLYIRSKPTLSEVLSGVYIIFGSPWQSNLVSISFGQVMTLGLPTVGAAFRGAHPASGGSAIHAGVGSDDWHDERQV